MSEPLRLSDYVTVPAEALRAFDKLAAEVRLMQPAFRGSYASRASYNAAIKALVRADKLTKDVRRALRFLP